MSNHSIIRRWLLEGRVQGVGCRAQVNKIAGKFEGLSGYVRNLPDGKVEVLAAAGAEVLENFEGALKKGLRFPVRLNQLTGQDLNPEEFSVEEFGGEFRIRK